METVFATSAEESFQFEPSSEVMDLSPADVANTVSIIGPYTNHLEEDPLTVALAVEDSDFLGKPVITSTEITEEPKPKEEKRTKTITYTVQEGDTLSKIAWAYGLKVATVKTMNNFSSDTIKP